jgi:glyoxylase-like metal-dependent hydrolase (beta-lactamase superfamily II)
VTQLADDIVHLPLFPRDGINAFLLGDVLVDAGAPRQGGRLLKQLVGRPVRTHVITHAHTDHAGSSRRIASELGIPVWVGAGDADVVESGAPPAPFDGPQAAVAERLTRFAGTPVARRLEEGDVVGPGFVVLDTPGHSAGHISLWRDADRTLVCGDVVNTMSLVTTRPGLQEPPQLFTADPALNRVSIRRIAELEPALLLAGHGPPWRDPAALAAFAASLPA